MAKVLSTKILTMDEEEDINEEEQEDNGEQTKAIVELTLAIQKLISTQQPTIVNIENNNKELISLLSTPKHEVKKAYRFTVQRNQQGFISSIDAREI